MLVFCIWEMKPLLLLKRNCSSLYDALEIALKIEFLASWRFDDKAAAF